MPAESVTQFFSEPHNIDMVQRLIANGVEIQNKPGSPANERFAGKTFVFTGALQYYTRETAEQLVVDAGGRAASSVSKKTDFVVVGENAGSKVRKAADLGIPVLTEAEFKTMAE